MQPTSQQPSFPATYPVSPGQPMRQDQGRPRISLWVWLISSLLALLCFLLVEYCMSQQWESVVIMWAPFLAGMVLLLVAGISALVGAGSLLRRPSGQAAVFALCCLGVFVGSIWRLGKAASALWLGVKGLAVVGGSMLLMTPEGLLVVGLLASLDAALRDAMENNPKPEWRLVQVEYAGTTSAGPSEIISFVFTNRGQLDIASMEGTLHVWNSQQYAGAELPIRPDRPLEAGQSVRLGIPVDDKGRKFLEVIKGVDAAPAPGEPAATQPAGVLHLRYQLRRLAAQGQVFEVRGGNIEPPKEAPAFGFKRGLNNAEWRLVGAKYLGMGPEDVPGRAVFSLEMPRQYEVAWLKGKLQVIDFERGSVEKQVELRRDASSSQPLMVVLDAGKQSELANQIITSRGAFDRAVGNDEQTTCIVRFQLQEMKTADGKAYAINLLGELKEK